jgi:pimeloyl-ACP methyl ester carboxylesterase
MNFLEEMVAESYDYQGYFVRRNVLVGPRKKGGRSGERSSAVFQMEDWPLSSIRCPTLIVHGTLDKDVPIAHAEFAHAQIANSELVRIEGADHLMFYTRYKELDRLVGGFIAKHQ